MDASQEWLGEVEFPASKSDLIDAAVDREAPQTVIERLQQLDREHYDSRAELDAALGDLD